MRYMLIIFFGFIVSGCATSPAPNLFNGNYYMVGDSNCVQGRSVTSTRIMCIDKNGKETGYRDAMTREQIQMYQYQAAQRQMQMEQLNQSMQRLGQSAQNSTQLMLQQSQSYSNQQYQPSFGQSTGGGISTYRQVGSTWLGSDGSTCRMVGSTVLCR